MLSFKLKLHRGSEFVIHKKWIRGDILKKSVLIVILCLFAFLVVGYTSGRIAYRMGDKDNVNIVNLAKSELGMTNPELPSYDPPPVSIASITVMTRNLYVGSAFNILLDISTPEEVPDLVAKVYARILSSQFPERAEAIADEIVKNQPDVVGLQEAPLLLFQPPSEASIVNQPQPAVAAIDYLQILIDVLQRRNAHYVVAAIVNNTDLTAPSTGGGTIRFIDRDVILVRTGSPLKGMLVLNPQAKNFEMQLKLRDSGK